MMNQHRKGQPQWRGAAHRILLLFKLTLFSMIYLLVSGCHQSVSGVLHPKGLIAYQERQLLFDALALMLVVVIPVIIMSFAFIFRYHRAHKTSEYKPNWSENAFFESIWWGVPCIIILILSIMTWKQTHKLDPYRPLHVSGQPLLIQVVALPWKWLFIYPEENIATVNYVMIPKGRPIVFWLTSDNVPMSAFFIPQLGSQIYTMAGMRTQLHLLATEEGVLRGIDAQYNGKGFSDMHFVVKVVSPTDMNRWIHQIQQSPNRLTAASYQVLLQPSVAHRLENYAGVPQHFFEGIIQTYMMPHTESHPRAFLMHK